MYFRGESQAALCTPAHNNQARCGTRTTVELSSEGFLKRYSVIFLAASMTASSVIFRNVCDALIVLRVFDHSQRRRGEYT